MAYQFQATETYWRRFYALSPSEKELVRSKWKIFKLDPFDESLQTHKIEALSGRARTTIYSVKVGPNLRAIFRIDGDVVTTLDIGNHAIYK